MLKHATRLADLTLTPFGSILQAAAGRAWVRTSPVRPYYRSFAAKHGAAVAVKERHGEVSLGVNTTARVGMRWVRTSPMALHRINHRQVGYTRALMKTPSQTNSVVASLCRKVGQWWMHTRHHILSLASLSWPDPPLLLIP